MIDKITFLEPTVTNRSSGNAPPGIAVATNALVAGVYFSHVGSRLPLASLTCILVFVATPVMLEGRTNEKGLPDDVTSSGTDTLT